MVLGVVEGEVVGEISFTPFVFPGLDTPRDLEVLEDPFSSKIIIFIKKIN